MTNLNLLILYQNLNYLSNLRLLKWSVSTMNGEKEPTTRVFKLVKMFSFCFSWVVPIIISYFCCPLLEISPRFSWFSISILRIANLFCHYLDRTCWEKEKNNFFMPAKLLVPRPANFFLFHPGLFPLLRPETRLMHVIVCGCIYVLCVSEWVRSEWQWSGQLLSPVSPSIVTAIVSPAKLPTNYLLQWLYVTSVSLLLSQDQIITH